MFLMQTRSKTPPYLHRHHLVFGLFMLLVLSTTYSHATERSIQVSANGKAYTTPEIAHFSVSFQNTSDIADDARKQSDAQVRSTLEALQAFSLDKQTLDSSQVILNPAYDYTDGKRKLLGYQVTRHLRFTLENLEQLESLIATLARNQIARLDQIRFDVHDDSTVRDEALQNASKKTQHAAKTLATSYGASLGGIVSVKHHIEDRRAPAPMHARAMSIESQSGKQSSSYEIKRLEFNARVEATFAIH